MTQVDLVVKSGSLRSVGPGDSFPRTSAAADTTGTAGSDAAGAAFPTPAPIAGPDGIAAGTASATIAEHHTSALSTVAAIAGNLPAVSAVAADASGNN